MIQVKAKADDKQGLFGCEGAGAHQPTLPNPQSLHYDMDVWC